MRDTYARNDNLSRRPAFSSPARFSAVGADLPEHRPRALAAPRPVLASMKKLAEPAEMVWSRASLVVGVQQYGGLARRLWHSPVAAVSAAAVAKAAPLHCCRLPRHRLTTPRRLRRNCRAALLHGCTAASICCAAPADALTAYCRTAPPRRSVTAPLLPLIVAPLRILPRRRAAPRLLPHRVAPLRPRRSAAAVLLPRQPLCYCRAAPLHCRVAPLRAAPRHSATCCQLCTAPPRCCRAASLLPRRFATATPQRVLLSDSKTCLQMKTGDQNTVA